MNVWQEHFAKRPQSCHLFTVSTKSQRLRNTALHGFPTYASVFGVQIQGTANKMDRLGLQRVYGQGFGENLEQGHRTLMLLFDLQQARYYN